MVQSPFFILQPMAFFSPVLLGAGVGAGVGFRVGGAELRMRKASLLSAETSLVMIRTLFGPFLNFTTAHPNCIPN